MPRRRPVLAITPGAARALLMVALPARDADHISIVRLDLLSWHLVTAGTYQA